MFESFDPSQSPRKRAFSPGRRGKLPGIRRRSVASRTFGSRVFAVWPRLRQDSPAGPSGPRSWLSSSLEGLFSAPRRTVACRPIRLSPGRKLPTPDGLTEPFGPVPPCGITRDVPKDVPPHPLRFVTSFSPFRGDEGLSLSPPLRPYSIGSNAGFSPFGFDAQQAPVALDEPVSRHPALRVIT